MTDGELLRLVDLPLAAAVILAGIRVATVVSVGVATIGAAIGAGGLGVYIFRGVATVDDTLIMAGALPAALMAPAADGAVGPGERRVAGGAERGTPGGRAVPGLRARRRRRVPPSKG